MEPAKRSAIIALLSEYKKAIGELNAVIAGIPDVALINIIDHSTDNPDCRSIQTVLTHVVRSGFSYSIYIARSKGLVALSRQSQPRASIGEYIQDLNKVVEYAEEILMNFADPEIEEFSQSNKIQTLWGKQYDVEQLMEHAIVHILRHRRQIEIFINTPGK